MDKAKILYALGITAELLGTPLSSDALSVMAGDLMEMAPTENDVLNALVKLRREHKGRLTLAAVIDRLPNSPMGPDAAWEVAMHLGVGDEEATIVAPKAILRAFPYSLWNYGDKIAARMAFKDAFPDALRRHGMRYHISEGNDPRGREPVILEALRGGLIPTELARHYLPELPAERFAIEDMTKVDSQEGLASMTKCSNAVKHLRSCLWDDYLEGILNPCRQKLK